MTILSAAQAQELPSTILNGSAPAMTRLSKAEFEALRKQMLAGETATFEQVEALSKPQYDQLMNALFVRRES